MGGWKNRRRIPRRKFDPNRYLYNDSASDRHDDSADNVPSWEKEFCKVIGSVPWGKVVSSKTLLDYHDNILHWDDSAGEEAFQNAKKRFWAEINDLNCDIPLPDPDLHIDRVNWSQVIDAELVEELDREYLNPDEMKAEAGTRSEEPVNDDPWERDRKQHNGHLKIQDWRSTVQKNDCNDVGWGSPWEPCSDMHNEWGDGTKFSSWSHWGDQPNKNSDACPQERRFQNMRFQNDEGWGNYDHTYSSQNYTKRLQLDRGANAWCHGQIQEKSGFHDRRSGGCVDKLYVCERWDNNRSRPKVDRILPPRNDDYWRCGSSHTHIPSYKRSRFQGENYPS